MLHIISILRQVYRYVSNKCITIKNMQSMRMNLYVLFICLLLRKWRALRVLSYRQRTNNSCDAILNLDYKTQSCPRPTVEKSAYAVSRNYMLPLRRCLTVQEYSWHWRTLIVSVVHASWFGVSQPGAAEFEELTYIEP